MESPLRIWVEMGSWGGGLTSKASRPLPAWMRAALGLYNYDVMRGLMDVLTLVEPGHRDFRVRRISNFSTGNRRYSLCSEWLMCFALMQNRNNHQINSILKIFCCVFACFSCCLVPIRAQDVRTDCRLSRWRFLWVSRGLLGCSIIQMLQFLVSSPNVNEAMTTRKTLYSHANNCFVCSTLCDVGHVV